MKVNRILPLLILLGILAIVPASADVISTKTGNYTPLTGVTRAFNFNNQLGDIQYDSTDINEPITVVKLEFPQSPGYYPIALTYNDGSTDTVFIESTMGMGLSGILQLGKVNMTLDGDTVTIDYPLSYYLSGSGATIGVSYLYDNSENTWLLAAGREPNFVVKEVEGKPADNPIKGVYIENSDVLTGEIQSSPYDLLDADTEVAEKGGISSVFNDIKDFFVTFWDTSLMILGVFVYLVAHLRMVLFMLEVGLLALSASTSKDFFGAIEKWFKYNRRLFSSLIDIMRGIIGIAHDGIASIPLIGKLIG